MAWERVELKTTRSAAFARITTGKQQQLILNKGASELLRKCQWVMIYLDVQKEVFAVDPLSQYEVGACKAHWVKKGGWSSLHHPQFVARIVSAGVVPGARMHVVSDLSSDKQLVFKFAKESDACRLPSERKSSSTTAPESGATPTARSRTRMAKT